MSQFISLNFNHTPLDFEALKQKYHEELPQINKESSRLPELLLIISAIACIFSLSYTIRTNLLNPRTQAAKPQPKKIPAAQAPSNNPTLTIKEIPAKYGDILIDKEVIADLTSHYDISTQGRKNYVIDKIVRYYIFQEFANQYKIDYKQSDNPSAFMKLVEDAFSMQQAIEEYLTSTEKNYSPYKSIDKLINERKVNFR